MTHPESGSTLRQWRERSGMTRIELADALGVHPDVVDHWQSGEVLPTPAEANILAAVLGMPPGLLMVAEEGEAPEVSEAPDDPEADDGDEVAIELITPERVAVASAPVKSRFDGLKEAVTARWQTTWAAAKRLVGDRSRFKMVLGLTGALFFFLLAAIGFSQAGDAQEEANDLREALASTASTAVGLRAERDHLASQLAAVGGRVEAAEQRAENAEEEARVEWEPLIEENEQLAAENRFLRKALVVSSAAGSVAGVGVTFDGDPTPDALDGLLDVLADNSVTATFFTSGVALQANPGAWARALADGHELGNVTYSRNPIDPDALDLTAEEIEAWQEVAREIAGEDYRTHWFRPPLLAGFEDRVGTQAIRKVIAQRGMITALWSVETYYALFSSSGLQAGGPDPDAAAVAAYVVGESGPGDILLLQFGSLDIEAVPAIIAGLRDKGLAPLNLTDLFDAQDVSFDGDLGVGGA